MSYLVLARKYRPHTFADMTGQEVVTETLRGAIQEGRIGHAYLFCGPRGTGKTTTARIFAKCLNCESGPSAEPCGTCERCIAADAQSDVDIVEIDAASNTGVDHVRDLRDQAAYRPLRARFKVYIVDEVHMLSKPAFNAFLKTLEEPPPHVKFLFATTDPQKLPETVISRCQVLRLSPLSETVIAARLDHVFGLEGIRAEAGVTRELARRARGGMRDALSAADQLLSLVGAEPSLTDVARLSAEGGTNALEALCDRIEARDAAGVLAALPASEGGEAELCSALLDHARASLVAALLGAATPQLQADQELRSKLHARGTRLGVARLEIWIAELLAARERMRFLPAHARAAFELALLELCRPETTATLAELAARLEALEGRLSSGARAAAPSGSGSASAPAGTLRPQPRPASSDGAPREPASRDLAPREPVSRDAASRDAASRDAVSRDAVSRDAMPREVSSREVPRRDVTPVDPRESAMRAPSPTTSAVAASAPAMRASTSPAFAPSMPASASVLDEPDASDLAPSRQDTSDESSPMRATSSPDAKPARTSSPSALATQGARVPLQAPPPHASSATNTTPTATLTATSPTSARAPSKQVPREIDGVDVATAPSGLRPRVAGVADAWARVLETLGADARSYADALRARGKLAELSGGRARVTIAGMRDSERALFDDARNQQRLAAAFERVLGEPVRVDLDDRAGARGVRDSFTGRVAELFEGRIEDEG